MKSKTLWLTLIFSVSVKAVLAASAATAPIGQADFVTRDGTKLMLKGQPFRFSGPNIYWLGQDRLGGKIVYPTQFRVDDALDTAREMGASVVRIETFGESTGNPLSIEPSLGVFNEGAFAIRDYVAQAARARGLRLIVPLVDNWYYSQGGKHHFTDWRGITDPKVEYPSADPKARQFYTDPQVISDYEQYISHVLNHVNPLTGVAYKDDPTFLCWETGDELEYCPSSWTKTISDFIKGLDSRHLVMDGKAIGDGFEGYSWDVLTNVDIESPHYHNEDLEKNAAFFAAHNKAMVVGEFKWNAPVDLAAYLTRVEANPQVSGDLYWSLFGHLDTVGYEPHDDNLTLHYPGDTPDMRARAQLLRAHAYKMRDLPLPPAAVPGAPLFTAVTRTGTQTTLAWRGVAGADTYTIERSSTGHNGPWTVICKQGVTDNDAPWKDNSTPAGSVWFRIVAYNLAGVAGPYSPVYVAPSIAAQ